MKKSSREGDLGGLSGGLLGGEAEKSESFGGLGWILSDLMSVCFFFHIYKIEFICLGYHY